MQAPTKSGGVKVWAMSKSRSGRCGSSGQTAQMPYRVLLIALVETMQCDSAVAAFVSKPTMISRGRKIGPPPTPEELASRAPCAGRDAW